MPRARRLLCVRDGSRVFGAWRRPSSPPACRLHRRDPVLSPRPRRAGGYRPGCGRWDGVSAGCRMRCSITSWNTTRLRAPAAR